MMLKDRRRQWNDGDDYANDLRNDDPDDGDAVNMI